MAGCLHGRLGCLLMTLEILYEEGMNMLRSYLLSIPLTMAMTGYLAGSWEINAQGSCGDNNAEHLVMHGDGAFEYSRRGKADAVGFWRIEDDVVVFDMMVSPASFQDIHAELQQFLAYQTYSMRAMPIDMQQDQFSAVVSIGDRMQRFNLRRCR
jgi:hypothetical protein